VRLDLIGARLRAFSDEIERAQIGIVALELWRRIARREIHPHVVASEAFGAGEEVPRLLANTTGRGGIFNFEFLLRATRRDQLGIVCFRIPAIAIRRPLHAVVMQHLRLDWRSVAGFPCSISRL
jgi:hypothetical protein